MSRVPAMSKNGKFYWKNDDEVNREAQRAHYLKYYKERTPLNILKQLELKGSIPQFISIGKFPDILTLENISDAWETFKENNEIPEKAQRRFEMLKFKMI